MKSVADPYRQPAVRYASPGRRGRVFLLLMVLAIIGAIAYPPTFLLIAREALGFEAWRYGFDLQAGEMSGSVWGPIWIYHATLRGGSEAGTSALLEIDRARAVLAWRHLFWARNERIWQELTLDGVRGAIDLPTVSREAEAGMHGRAEGKARRLLLPSMLAISRGSIVIRQSEGMVKLDDIDLQASDHAAGHVVIGALSIQEPWMLSVFSNCRGALSLDNSKLVLSGMKLSDSLSIDSASADLPELLRGQLEMEFALDAFSGNVQGELKSGAHEDHLSFEGSGTFANISVKQLAAFFAEDADGTINEGKFTFRGSPRALAKAMFTTRFEAGAFRWGARRWNSLVVGATYVDHRLQIPEFELRQAHNTLTLDGDMSVPDDWKRWWKTNFNFDLSAKINNLGELSALLGPEYGGIFGKLTVDGSVRGENASFNGQIIVSGSHLSFRKAPLDELRAAIKLDGNEIQVTNAEFTHADDFLRAQGVVNILGEKRYSGEVKASIADLALYADFLQPPVAPEAFGGGLMLDWSGDGTAAAHSGAFSLRLSRIHPLANGAAAGGGWQPMDLSADGTYSPESIFFSNLVIGNGQTTLASQVVATPKSLGLESMKLFHGESVWLSGSAQVPLNVWAAWQNPSSAAWWNFQSPCKVDMAANGLSIKDALLLTGRRQPFGGIVTGNLKTDGTLGKLTAVGHLVIKNASGPICGGTLQYGDATLDLAGTQAALTAAAGEWDGLAWSGSGTIAGTDVRKISLDLTARLPGAALRLGDGIDGVATLDLRAAGTPEALALSGSAALQRLTIERAAGLRSSVAQGGLGLEGAPPALALALNAPPAWKLDVQVGGETAVALANTSGTAMPALEISGSIGRPVVSGSIGLRGFAMTEGADSLVIQGGAILLDGTGSPGLALHASGVAGGEPFDGYIFGTIAEKHFTWAPEVTEALDGQPGIPAAAGQTPQPFSLGLGSVHAALSPARGSP